MSWSLESIYYNMCFAAKVMTERSEGEIYIEKELEKASMIFEIVQECCHSACKTGGSNDTRDSKRVENDKGSREACPGESIP